MQGEGKRASVERLLHLRMNDGHTVLAQRFCEKFLNPRRIHPGIERHVRNGVRGVDARDENAVNHGHERMRALEANQSHVRQRLGELIDDSRCRPRVLRRRGVATQGQRKDETCVAPRRLCRDALGRRGRTRRQRCNDQILIFLGMLVSQEVQAVVRRLSTGGVRACG